MTKLCSAIFAKHIDNPKDLDMYVSQLQALSAADVSIRDIHEVIFKVMDPSTSVIDVIPGDRALFQIYPGAVYLHQVIFI